ncbi:MAG: glycosyltransferase [Siculibacillus sp.]
MDTLSLRAPPRLAIVVPCFNEERALPSTLVTLRARLEAMVAGGIVTADSFVLCVDDGSLDRTWEIIAAAHAAEGARVDGVRLAVNAGHQNALLAGLMAALPNCDVSISIDADLQDDPAAMDAMIEAHRRGAELVLGVRTSRPTDGWFKRGTAAAFYRGMRLLGADLVLQHADFRLMSRAAMRNLAAFPEYHLFLRGLQRRLHDRVAHVHYDQRPRAEGESKYTLGRMVSLALDGVTSFSVVPLRLIAVLGALIFLVSSALALYALTIGLIGHTVPGWASIAVPLYAINGLTLFCLGIVGEYVGKIYMEAKQRPRYLIDETTLPERGEVAVDRRGGRTRGEG